MMRSAFVLIVMTGLVALCSAQARPQRKAPKSATSAAQSKQQFAEDQKAIAELQQRDIAASMAFDVNELLSLWTDDGVLLPPDHEPIVGREALRSYFDEQKKRVANSDILGYDENWNEVSISGSGDLAYQWGTITARLQPGTEKTENTYTVHAIRILKRQPDGSWLVARAIWNKAPAAPNSASESPK